VRAGWQVLADVALRLGVDLGVATATMASRQLFDAVPFYGGLTLEEIGGRGVRWQEREAASAFPTPDASAEELVREPQLVAEAGEVAGYRSLWDAPEVEFSPALRFLFPRERAGRRALEAPAT
jgi:NADH-quinone oxidoreductase subunit G